MRKCPLIGFDFLRNSIVLKGPLLIRRSLQSNHYSAYPTGVFLRRRLVRLLKLYCVLRQAVGAWILTQHAVNCKEYRRGINLDARRIILRGMVGTLRVGLYSMIFNIPPYGAAKAALPQSRMHTKRRPGGRNERGIDSEGPDARA